MLNLTVTTVTCCYFFLGLYSREREYNRLDNGSLATGAEKKNTTERKTNTKNSQDKVVKPVPCTGMSWMNLLIQEQMLDKAVEMGNGIRLASDPFKMCMVF